MEIKTKVCGSASHERMRGVSRTVFVLGMGTSPAVLTEMIGEGLKESWDMINTRKMEDEVREAADLLHVDSSALMKIV